MKPTGKQIVLGVIAICAMVAYAVIETVKGDASLMFPFIAVIAIVGLGNTTP